MTLKRATRDELEADPGLYEAVLARLIGAHTPGEPPGHPYEVCREMGLSYGGLVAWINADATGKRMQEFRNVQEIRAHLLAEQTLSIADGADDVPKARLQVDTRFRLAKAYAPTVYGNTDGQGPQVGVTIVLTQEDRAA